MNRRITRRRGRVRWPWPCRRCGRRPSNSASCGSALKRVQQFKDVEMTEAEEAQLGAEVSTRIRARYGVVQDQAVHRYVSLVGMALVMASSKPGPNWKFIVLDTDAVNAFAAPGGFVHITKGALANLKNESELAGVLAHEIIHVTDKHTIRAIQKGKLVQMGADETVAGNSALMSKLADKAYEVIESGFGRGEELESDEKGIVHRQRRGLRPAGHERLPEHAGRAQQERAAGQERPVRLAPRDQGAHRQDDPADRVGQAHLDGHGRPSATPRRSPSRRCAAAEIATIEAGSAGAAGATAKPAEEPKKKGLGGLTGALRPSGGERKSAQVTGSGAARGAGGEDRLAKGGVESGAGRRDRERRRPRRVQEGGGTEVTRAAARG